VTDKTALVSGGTYGIGRAIVAKLAQCGFRVATFGLEPERSRETREILADLGLGAEVLTCDVARAADLREVTSTVLDRFDGRIDVLVNNAATRFVGTILDTTYDINLNAVFLLTKQVIVHMIDAGQGAIVNLGSTSGWGGWNHIAYCVSKGALVPFTKCLALDHAKDHIRVNAVLPGATLTGMTENQAPDVLDTWKSTNVAGRVGTPEDIANTVAFLVSPAAETISGAVLEVGTLPGFPVRG
jgi:NAD(P)-dependent dehydrogenase (short-subunit alcohol dehydrogenase family)